MRKIHEEEGKAIYGSTSLFKTSRTEILHLLAGMFVFFVVESISFLRFGIQILLVVGGIIIFAFIVHELAHKFTAQYYGLWSEFRIDPRGIVLSLLTALSPIKIIAPGAVVIFGSNATSESMGKIALAGPLSNIVQVFVFTALSQFSSGFFSVLFWFAASLNTDLALFNLIPISILDGQKVFSWSKITWAIVFATALILWLMLQRI